MPNRPVTVRRWEVAGAFVLLVFTFVLAVVLVSRESKARSEANRELIEEIQANRADITYTGCLDQNARHDATVGQIDKLITNRKAAIRMAIKTAGSAQEADALRAQLDSLDDGRATTVSLVDALAPLQNCQQVVLDRFGFVPKIEGGDG